MKCTVCEIGCDIPEGRYGRCNMYTNQNSKIIERFPESYLTVLPITIETMPMVHFAPKNKFLQVNTVGCNFKCQGCISETLTSNVDALAGALTKASAADIVHRAKTEECQGIVFCLNDPAASYYTFLALAKETKSANLWVGCSTNGYFTEKALTTIIPYLDFVNIGLKGSSDARYKECGAKSAAPVFRNIRMLHEAGIHVETSAMYINGNDEEILKAAKEVASVSKDIPLQVMRFVPFGEAKPELEPTINKSEQIVGQLRSILNYVYLFNSPGTEYLTTACPICGNEIIKREFYGPMGCRTTDSCENGKCSCGWLAPVKGPINSEQFTEYGMLGGYRTTRAIEMAHAILITLGIRDNEELGEILGDIIKEDFIRGLHDRIQQINSWIGLINDLAMRTGREKEGSELITFIQERVDKISEGSKLVKSRPSVYYSMGYPLFALNAERFETNLVESVGGICVNKSLTRKGKPGVNISVNEINELGPDIMFISGFLSSPASDYIQYCSRHGIDNKAVQMGNIFNVPAGWDFGSPRWILGFMFLANAIHPEIFSFDLETEQKEFYKRFYGIDAENVVTNRDFSRPALTTPKEI
ncbi:radical SAM protein [Methanococcus maripaludis]|uniref:Pyruvate-formate lyase-activating enzyme n=2 Tax=Methanococcus maripaludis TaxID=39152 RepID=A0A7J9PHV5_METMI|nr:radical SAM protein [Methanococcus maripaludis]MBA2862815.1 pyruvate-formate lyase-activating enzyme [Methanococcus maripaludis]